MTTINQQVKDIAAENKADVSLAEQIVIATHEAGVAKAEGNPFVDLAPEDLRPHIPSYQNWERSFIAAATLAGGMANVGAMSGDKSLDSATTTVQMGDNELTVKNLRSGLVNAGPGTGEKKEIPGQLKVNYDVSAAGASRGELKKAKTIVHQYAAAILSGE
jgi:hypothetical protein